MDLLGSQKYQEDMAVRFGAVSKTKKSPDFRVIEGF